MPVTAAHTNPAPFMCCFQQYFSKWGDSGIIDFKDEFSKLITLTAARTLLGKRHTRPYTVMKQTP